MDRSFRVASALEELLWGKQSGLTADFYPVICHLLDVAAVAGEVWDRVISGPVRARLAAAFGVSVDQMRSLFMFWAGAHDCGKISPEFQSQVERLYRALVAKTGLPQPVLAGKKPIPHQMITALVLPDVLRVMGYPGHATKARKSVAHVIAQLLGGHHGVIPARLHRDHMENVADVEPRCGNGRWKVQQRAHMAALRHLTGARAIPAFDKLDAADAALLCGFIVVCDWLASDTDFIDQHSPHKGWRATPDNVAEHWRRSAGAARGLVAAAGLGSACLPEQTFAQAFPTITDPYPLQESIATRLPHLVSQLGLGGGLVLITAPTGDGKTEAGLYAASVLARAFDRHGIYFALPTMATASAMFKRVRHFVKRNATGDQAVTLAHSMAFLDDAIRTGQSDDAEGAVATRDPTVEADWLYGRHRPLLANFAVGTIDQALTAILPVKFNFLRTTGLSNKVLVIDEAHAYGPGTHLLLERLLEWCAATGIPVVLMSATVTGKVATSLVNAYRRGAGHTSRLEVAPVYPGWGLVGAATGELHVSPQVPSTRATDLDVDIRNVATGRPRLDAITTTLAPIRDQGGCAMVVCATVAEAQDTFDHVKEWAAGSGMDVHLLHSRFPTWRRLAVTHKCEHLYGKKDEPLAGMRPGSVLITTSIVESSLDFDFDIVVSDLAPLAMLLQRAGRCQRHRGTVRPDWAGPYPGLVVLSPCHPSNGELSIPPQWGSVYSASLLHRTHRLLHDRAGKPIRIPEDVQTLVDRVYADDFVDHIASAEKHEHDDWKAALEAEDMERLGQDLAERMLASAIAIDTPSAIGDLAGISCKDGISNLDADLITTRFGADSTRVVCLYQQPNGPAFLRPDGTVPVPGHDTATLTNDALRTIMNHAIPVPAAWTTGIQSAAPPSWGTRALTRNVIAIHMTNDGPDWTNNNGPQSLRIDSACERGLIRRRSRSGEPQSLR